MNIQAINAELAKIGYKAVPIKTRTRMGKEARIPWPLGPKKLGAPRFRSRCYGSTVGSSTAARISAAEYAEIKKRSNDMFLTEAT